VPSHRDRARRDEHNVAAEPAKSCDIVDKCLEPGPVYRATIPIYNEIRSDLYDKPPSAPNQLFGSSGTRNRRKITASVRRGHMKAHVSEDSRS
jgi:hypothetical protein